MALPPIWTQADVNALARTIASGLLTVRYGGPPEREETYQSLGAMRSLLAAMRLELNGQPTVRLAATRTGLNSPRGTGRFGGFGDFDDGSDL